MNEFATSSNRLKLSLAGLILAMSFSASVLTRFSLPAFAESNATMIKKAVKEYAAGDYGESAGHFYAVLTTEFNNPSVHYYMASCYVHLKDPESAVREFRIAYALAPHSDIGAYATTALKYFGMSPDGNPLSKLPSGATTGSDSSSSATASTAGSPPAATAASKIPLQDKNAELLNAQVEREKNSRIEQTKKLAEEIQHQGNDRIAKTITAAGGNGNADIKDRDKEILRLPDDTKAMLTRLQNEYNSRQETQLGAGKDQAAKLDESAANLRNLIEQHHSVEAAGSNLYVRNYKKK